jgi:hypothetical protein
MSNRKAFTPEEFLDCVKRIFSLSDSKLAKCLGVGRTSVWRFKRDPENKEIVQEAMDYLESFNDETIDPKTMSFEIFRSMLPIRKWENSMRARRVGEPRIMAWMRAFWRVCKKVGVLPSKITVEQCAKLCVEQRNKYYAGEPQEKGLYYSSIREGIRGFFMSVHNMSGLYLKNLGIGTEALLGSGKYSRQLVPQEVRHRLEELLVSRTKKSGDVAFFETLGNCKFNFSTGTRITASLAFGFESREFELKPHKWMFEIFDKGTRGTPRRWEKILMGDLLEHFKKYCSLRFNLPIRNLESELPTITDSLFPAFIDAKGTPDTDLIRSYVKPALIDAGIPYKDFPPTHIWRHTFAQEALRATDYNYELVASLGGWVNTRILKEHYGKMGESAREKGLLKMMGVKLPDETYELKW